MRHVSAALAFIFFAAGAVADESPEELDRLLAATFGDQDDESAVPPAFGDPDLLTPAFQAADRRVFDRAVPFSMRRSVGTSGSPSCGVSWPHIPAPRKRSTGAAASG